jgi:glutathione S-transferase
MKIYGDLSSGNCLKVKYTADFLQLPYEWVPIDVTKGESRTPEFLSMNPAGQVPVVELDDGRVLSQSNAIIRFLADATSLLPKDSFDRAKVDELLFWEQYSHEPYIAVCRYQMFYLKKSKEEREDWRVEKGETALDLMDKMLIGKDWLAAAQFSVADIGLIAYTRLAHEGGFDLSTRANVQKWIVRCEEKLCLDTSIKS